MCAVCFLGASFGYGQTLRILNWEAFLSDDSSREWESRTGATIDQVYFDNDENRNTPNLSHVDPQWLTQCGEYSTPYQWGTMGLVYRKDILSTPPLSWSAPLNPAAHDLHLALSCSGDQYELNELSGGDVWGFVIPEEGTVTLARRQHYDYAMDSDNVATVQSHHQFPGQYP